MNSYLCIKGLIGFVLARSALLAPLEKSAARYAQGRCIVVRSAASHIFYDGYHILTQEAKMSTHYFWSASRNFALDDDSCDASLCEAVAQAFGHEDEPMIAACQLYMGTTDLFSLRPALLETDVQACRYTTE
jgi:hypothetical protein